MWTLVIIIIALNHDQTSAPAITNIPRFKSEDSCIQARGKTSDGNLDTINYLANIGGRGLIAYECIMIE
jgi:hypothetical protein